MERPDFVETKHLEYLDDLRESGIINMVSARPYIADTFGLDLKVSRDILSYWMESFGDKNR